MRTSGILANLNLGSVKVESSIDLVCADLVDMRIL
jgi:hypothetical protein